MCLSEAAHLVLCAILCSFCENTAITDCNCIAMPDHFCIYEILQLCSMKIAILVVDCNELARFTLFLQTEDIFSHLDSLKAKRSGILETLTAIKQKIMEVESQQTEAVREVGSSRLYAFISGAWWMLSCILRFLCHEVSLPRPLLKMFCKNRGTNLDMNTRSHTPGL